MTTFTVTTAADVVSAGDGRLSLREAVIQANATSAADTIVFAAGLETQTLVLTGGELVLRQDVTIDGDQNNDGQGVVLSGGDDQRILRTSGAGTDVGLQDITLIDGYTPGAAGGGIFAGSGTNVSLRACEVASCRGEHGGGGINAANGSQVTVIDSIMRSNIAVYGGGGAIAGDSLAAITIRHCILSENIAGYYQDGGAVSASILFVEDSVFSRNIAAGGGAISIISGNVNITRSSLISNGASYGGALQIINSNINIENTTISDNRAFYIDYGVRGGGVCVIGDSALTIANSTITNNVATIGGYGSTRETASGGGIDSGVGVELTLLNTIVAGNAVRHQYGGPAIGPDIYGTITSSNGHNIFGSDVAGDVPGDREGIASGLIFAALDPETGGGLVNAAGAVPLRNAITNPALSGADPLGAPAGGQLGGARPLPAGSLPDIGSLEINHALSTTASANNDVLTGTAAGNAINGLAGHDYLKGLGGADTLHGNDGGDLLDGGTGNDKLYGDTGIDLVFYGGAAKVTIDLSGAVDTAKRGSETDTLYNVEGAIGSSAADTFKGDALDNLFQGGGGKDTATGGAGRDLYDFNAAADSKAGTSTRDVITDFAHLTDKIDVMGLDADTTVAGNQAFHWVGNAALTGPGEIGYVTTGGNTIIRASNDGDAASEFEIQLTGIKTLGAVDFYL